MKTKLSFCFNLLLFLSLLILPFLILQGCVSTSGEPSESINKSIFTEDQWQEMERVGGDIWRDYLAREEAKKEAETPAPVPTPEPKPTPTPGQNPGGDPTFLWKPDSERGPLVVLVPNLYYETHDSATISGSFGSAKGNMTGRDGNGNRPHFRFAKRGGDYGRNITFALTLKSGEVVTWLIPHGASRFEQR